MSASTELSLGETKARIAEMLTDLSKFYRGEVEQETYRTYAPKLADIPLDILQEAFDKCSDELKFFPLIAEIKERVASVRAARSKARKDIDWERLSATEVCPRCNNTNSELIYDEAGNPKGARACTH